MGSDNDSIKKEPEKIDSIIYFRDILEERKDSIALLSADEQEMLKSIEDLKLHLQMDEEKNQMNMDFLFDFKKALFTFDQRQNLFQSVFNIGMR